MHIILTCLPAGFSCLVGGWSGAVHGLVGRIFVYQVIHIEKIGPVICLLNHISFFQLLYYFVLPVIKGNEEHVHILERCRLLVELRLKDRIVHEIHASHPANYHIGGLVRGVISVMVSRGRVAHHRGAHYSVNILQRAVSATVLVKGIGLVDCRSLAGDLLACYRLLWQGRSNAGVKYVVGEVRRQITRVRHLL